MHKLILFFALCAGLVYAGNHQRQCGPPPEYAHSFPFVYFDQYRYNVGARVPYICHVEDDYNYGYYSYSSLTCRAGRRAAFWYQDSSKCFPEASCRDLCGIRVAVYCSCERCCGRKGFAPCCHDHRRYCRSHRDDSDDSDSDDGCGGSDSDSGSGSGSSSDSDNGHKYGSDSGSDSDNGYGNNSGSGSDSDNRYASDSGSDGHYGRGGSSDSN